MSVVPEQGRVELNDGGSVRYDAVLVATGAFRSLVLARGLGGVLGLCPLEDAVRIREAVLAGSQIAVVRGGLAGIKLVCALREGGD